MSILLRLPEKMNIARVWSGQNVMPSSVVGSMPKKNPDVSLPEVPASIFKKRPAESEPVKASASQTETTKAPADQHILVVDDKSIEPNLFIALRL